MSGSTCSTAFGCSQRRRGGGDRRPRPPHARAGTRGRRPGEAGRRARRIAARAPAEADRKAGAGVGSRRDLGPVPSQTRDALPGSVASMEEARQVLERLARIEELERSRRPRASCSTSSESWFGRRRPGSERSPNRPESRHSRAAGPRWPGGRRRCFSRAEQQKTDLRALCDPVFRHTECVQDSPVPGRRAASNAVGRPLHSSPGGRAGRTSAGGGSPHARRSRLRPPLIRRRRRKSSPSPTRRAASRRRRRR